MEHSWVVLQKYCLPNCTLCLHKCKFRSVHLAVSFRSKHISYFHPGFFEWPHLSLCTSATENLDTIFLGSPIHNLLNLFGFDCCCVGEHDHFLPECSSLHDEWNQGLDFTKLLVTCFIIVYLGLPLSLKCHFGPSLPAEKDEKLTCKMSDITEQNSSTKRWWNSMLILMETSYTEIMLNWREGDWEAEVSKSETFRP